MHHSRPATDAPAIEAAVVHLADQRPAYAAILAFYGPVFAAQVQAEEVTSPAVIDVDETLLTMRSKEGFALIEPATFTIDVPAAETLLVRFVESQHHPKKSWGVPAKPCSMAWPTVWR